LTNSRSFSDYQLLPTAGEILGTANVVSSRSSPFPILLLKPAGATFFLLAIAHGSDTLFELSNINGHLFANSALVSQCRVPTSLLIPYQKATIPLYDDLVDEPPCYVNLLCLSLGTRMLFEFFFN
jgi:hypothetical protein